MKEVNETLCNEKKTEYKTMNKNFRILEDKICSI